MITRDEIDASRRHGQLVGDNIRRLREQAGLTQQRLALMIDADRREVVRWEGGHAPNAYHLEQLAEALEVHWTDFYKR